MDNVKTDGYYIQKIRRDLETVYETLKNDIPELLDLLPEEN